MNMSDIHALSGAYAVDALDDIERAQFERHLAGCSACTAEVESLREASALFAETTTVTPPANLRSRVLADIATVRPLPPILADTSHRSRRPGVRFLAAAAAVIAVGAGAVVWNPFGDDTSQSPPSAVQRVLQAQDAERYVKSFPDGSEATLVRSKSLNQAVLVTKNMAAAPTDHDYALWLQHDNVMVPAGIMPAGADNSVLLSGDAASAEGAGITVEESGREPTEPSDDVVALFDFETTP
jgi:anti-sigma-K factor RskA